MVMCVVYRTPASHVIRALLPVGHTLNVVYRSLIMTGCLMCLTSLTSIFFDWCFCCFKNNSTYKHSRTTTKESNNRMVKKRTTSPNVIIYTKRDGGADGEEDSFFLTNKRPESGLDPEVTITSDFLPEATSSLIEESSFMASSPVSFKTKTKNKQKENQNKGATKHCNGNSRFLKSNGHASHSMKTFPRNFKTCLQYDSSGVEVDESVALTDAQSLEVPSSSPTSTTSKASSKKTRSRTCFLCFWIFMLVFLFTLQLSIAFIGFIASTDLDMKSQDDKQTLSFIHHLLHDWESHDVSDDVVIDKTTGNHSENDSISEDKDFVSHLLLSNPRRIEFDSIESTLKCCGLRDYEDYPRAIPVPDSCCRSPPVHDNNGTAVVLSSSFSVCGLRKHPSNIYYDGCGLKIMESIRDELNLLSSLSLAFSAVEIFGLIFSCSLYINVLRRSSLNLKKSMMDKPTPV